MLFSGFIELQLFMYKMVMQRQDAGTAVVRHDVCNTFHHLAKFPVRTIKTQQILTLLLKMARPNRISHIGYIERRSKNI